MVNLGFIRLRRLFSHVVSRVSNALQLPFANIFIPMHVLFDHFLTDKKWLMASIPLESGVKIWCKFLPTFGSSPLSIFGSLLRVLMPSENRGEKFWSTPLTKLPPIFHWEQAAPTRYRDKSHWKQPTDLNPHLLNFLYFNLHCCVSWLTAWRIMVGCKIYHQKVVGSTRCQVARK